jgi:hypothetical protein
VFRAGLAVFCSPASLARAGPRWPRGQVNLHLHLPIDLIGWQSVVSVPLADLWILRSPQVSASPPCCRCLFNSYPMDAGVEKRWDSGHEWTELVVPPAATYLEVSRDIFSS